MISILILANTEQLNLPGCLASITWCDDIHVLDSGSMDDTPVIARAAGARVTHRPFDDWSSHYNWALRNLPFVHPWVFYLDADERCTPELHAAMVAVVHNEQSAAPAGNVAYRIQRRDFFLGTWLQHVQTSPFYMRLFRPEAMHYERLVHSVSKPNGPVGQITGYLDHFPFSKGVGNWFKRHNEYSDLEAQQVAASRRGQAPFSLRDAFFEKDFNKRRYHQKELFYRTPARPVVKFLVLYIAKQGFLDGRAGFTYSVLQAIYEYMIVLKTEELETTTNS